MIVTPASGHASGELPPLRPGNAVAFRLRVTTRSRSAISPTASFTVTVFPVDVPGAFVQSSRHAPFAYHPAWSDPPKARPRRTDVGFVQRLRVQRIRVRARDEGDEDDEGETCDTAPTSARGIGGHTVARPIFAFVFLSACSARARGSQAVVGRVSRETRKDALRASIAYGSSPDVIERRVRAGARTR